MELCIVSESVWRMTGRLSKCIELEIDTDIVTDSVSSNYFVDFFALNRPARSSRDMPVPYRIGETRLG